MSKERSDDLTRMLEDRAKAATKVEDHLLKIGAKIGDLLTARYSNGTSLTAPYNGWLKTEVGAKYLRLGTGSVPPVYISEIKKES